MDNFKIIYRILKYLESVLDCVETDKAPISHQRLNVTYERWEQLMIMLQANGYVEGLVYTQTLDDDKPHLTEPIKPRITMKGLEYLSENNMMHKAARMLKGIKDSIPGM